MGRLTEKVKNTEDYIRLATKDKQEFINKLGRIEDLEEQIGCPLDVVFTALSRGFYIDINKVEIDPPLQNSIEELLLVNCPKDFRLNLWYERIEVASFGHYLEIYLKDYKKTWFLKNDKGEKYVYKNKKSNL